MALADNKTVHPNQGKFNALINACRKEGLSGLSIEDLLDHDPGWYGDVFDLACKYLQEEKGFGNPEAKLEAIYGVTK